jgi:hypothetical protein
VISAEFGREKLMMFCSQCGYIYMVTAPRFRAVGGACVATNYVHPFMQTYPDVVLTTASHVSVPKIFQFKIYHPADDNGSDGGSDS